MSGIIGGAGSKSGIIGETEIDYEEGIWTATNHDFGTFLDVTQVSTYVKIGKMVHLSFRQTGGSIDPTKAWGQLGGLPFPASQSHSSPNAVQSSALNLSQIMIYQAQLSRMLFFSDFGSVSTLNFNIVYETT